MSTTRTLVLGIPLPHVSFDNYSFISAPAFSEYDRLIVETAAVSSVVEQVVSGTGEQRNFAGQMVHNASSTAGAFSLADLLQMRRREAEWFFSRGGLTVCFARPDVAHAGVDDLCGWRRYSWLPAPPGFRYEDQLLPGFGTPGAELADESHAFAPFVSEFASRVAYRATIDETAPNFSDYGRVFARSRGGAAIAVELALGRGHLVLLPTIADPQPDRARIAQTLHTCFERWIELRPHGRSPA